MRRCLYVCIGWLALASAAAASGPGLEYRFKTQDGVEFKCRDGKVEKLERQPFMVTPTLATRLRSSRPIRTRRFVRD